MEIVVVGSHEFTLGFQLAGVPRLYHPSSEKEMASAIRETDPDCRLAKPSTRNITRFTHSASQSAFRNPGAGVLGSGAEQEHAIETSNV